MSWEGFIEQARRSLSDPDFANRERVYKLQIAESLRGFLEAAERDEDWRTELRQALGRTYGVPPFRGQYNLSRFSQHQWLHKLPDEYAEEARAVLVGMLAQQDPVERFAAFADLASARADGDGAQPGSVLALGSVLNMAIDPTQLPPMKTTVLRHAEEKVGFPKAPGQIAEAYSHHLNFIDECSRRLDEAGIVVQDHLDVQSILWEWESRVRFERRAARASALVGRARSRDGLEAPVDRRRSRRRLVGEARRPRGPCRDRGGPPEDPPVTARRRHAHLCLPSPHR